MRLLRLPSSQKTLVETGRDDGAAQAHVALNWLEHAMAWLDAEIRWSREAMLHEEDEPTESVTFATADLDAFRADFAAALATLRANEKPL